MSEFKPAVDFVLHNECNDVDVINPVTGQPWGVRIADVGGGFVDDPDDAGGPTVYGLSRLIRHREGLTPEDFQVKDFSNASLKLVTRETAENIYRRIYWERYPYRQILNQDVANKIMDTAVNLAVILEAHKIAQKACNALWNYWEALLVEDGVLGIKTVTAINSRDPQHLLKNLCDFQRLWYEALIVQKPQFEKFRRQWMVRAATTHI